MCRAKFDAHASTMQWFVVAVVFFFMFFIIALYRFFHVSEEQGVN